MGMYDHIKVEVELPCRVPKNAEWQSKDSPAQQLDTYRITEKGLIHEAYTLKVVPEEDRKPGPGCMMLPVFECVDQRDEFCLYTGSINFYDYIDKQWWEFCAFFERGRLLKIVTIETPNRRDLTKTCSYLQTP